MSAMKASDLTAGIPKKKAKKDKEIASDYYKLGRTAASLERDKKDIEQQTQLNMVQQVALQELMLKIKEMSLELENQQKMAIESNMMAGGGGYPPMPPELGMPPGMPPPLDVPPPGMPPPLPVDGNMAMGGLPMGGPPPEMAIGPAPPMM